MLFPLQASMHTTIKLKEHSFPYPTIKLKSCFILLKLFLMLWRLITIIKQYTCVGVGGVMVSIVAFQAIDPGSIPGQRIFLPFFFFLFFFFFFSEYNYYIF